MASALWPDYTKEDLTTELKNIATSKKHEIFIARHNNEYIGFITVSIRVDYVEGAVSSPVGYIEGIYVKPDYRKKGVARRLFHLGEAWSFENGCQQMGSDTWAWNKQSQEFHYKLGFEEEDTLVHFIKDIDPKILRKS